MTRSKRDPADTLEALACMRALEAGAARDVRIYADPEFRAGRSVRYCHGPGFPVVVCYSRAELDHALATGRKLFVH